MPEDNVIIDLPILLIEGQSEYEAVIFKFLEIRKSQGDRSNSLSCYLSSPNAFSDPPAELSSCWCRGLRCVHSPSRGKWAGEVSLENTNQETKYKHPQIK